MGEDADPVITNGFESGEWKLTLNTIKLEDALQLMIKLYFLQVMLIILMIHLYYV